MMSDDQPTELSPEKQAKLLDKLSKLKAMAEGAGAIGNEEEAQAFAAMFAHLLTKHKLDMTDIEFASMEKEEPVERHFIDYRKYPDVKMRSNRVDWIETLAGVIADAYYCRILVHPGSSRITLVGRRSDAVIAEYMIVTLQRAVDKMSVRETDRYKRQMKAEGDRSRGNGFRSSWINGFIHRLAQRYREERQATTVATGDTSTALVRVDRAKKAVDDYMEQNRTKRASELSTSVRFHREGIRRGREAADAINLKANAIDTPSAKKRLTE